MLLGQTGQLAQFTDQHGKDEQGFHAFAAQPLQHAQGVPGLAVEHGIGEAEDVKACAVGNAGLHGVDVHLLAVGEQFELFDFLGGGQQVAFHAGADQLQGFGAGGQAGLGQALAFFLTKKKKKPEDKDTAHETIYYMVGAWLCDASSKGRIFSEDADVLTSITQSDMAHYMAAQNEALALLQWLKKFAVALLPKED